MAEKTAVNARPVGQPPVLFAPNVEPAVLEAAELVVRLDARAMSGPSQTFSEIGNALLFPGYFGYNWDALVECLGDVGEWLQKDSVLVLVDDADVLVIAEHLPLLVDVLCFGSERAEAQSDADGIPVERQVTRLRFVFKVSVDVLNEIRVRVGRNGRRMNMSPSGLEVW